MIFAWLRPEPLSLAALLDGIREQVSRCPGHRVQHLGFHHECSGRLSGGEVPPPAGFEQVEQPAAGPAVRL